MKTKGESKRIFLSFVGTNDAGKLIGKNDGAILTALSAYKKGAFAEIALLCTDGGNPTFIAIGEYLKQEILKRKIATKVSVELFPLKNPTDHNEIYPKLLAFCNLLAEKKKKKYTAAIASGTPSMQACWILLAESGDFPLELIRSNEPKFGNPPVTSVKLGTALPKIVRLLEENEQLRKQNTALLPMLIISLKNGTIQVGEELLPLSPIEFSYYCFFAKAAKEGKEFLRVSGTSLAGNFVEEVNSYYKTAFVNQAINLKKHIDSTTFRGNVSKANKKIREAVSNAPIARYYEISILGKRHAKVYGLQLPEEKIRMKE